jgi:hypothetical protein
MEAKQIKDLMEAYTSVYTQPEDQEVLSEDLQSAVKSGLKKGSEFMKKNPVGKAIGAVIAPVGKGRGTVTKAEQEEKIKSNKQENVDVFDLIKGHLLDEGYADTEESALVIMANMSEEWRQSILSEDPVQDYRDMKRSQENSAGMRGPELSHSSKSKGPKSPGSATQKPKPRSREFTKPPS